MLIVQLLRGRSPAEAVPILASSSPAVIAAVAVALAQELGGDAAGPELVRDDPAPAKGGR